VAAAAALSLARPISCLPLGGGGAVDGRFGYLRMVAEDAVRDIAFELDDPMLAMLLLWAKVGRGAGWPMSAYS